MAWYYWLAGAVIVLVGLFLLLVRFFDRWEAEWKASLRRYDATPEAARARYPNDPVCATCGYPVRDYKPYSGYWHLGRGCYGTGEQYQESEQRCPWCDGKTNMREWPEHRLACDKNPSRIPGYDTPGEERVQVIIVIVLIIFTIAMFILLAHMGMLGAGQ